MKFSFIGKNIDQESIDQCTKIMNTLFLELGTEKNYSGVGSEYGGDFFLFTMLYPVAQHLTYTIPTAATDGRRYYWNPEFLKKCNAQGVRIVAGHEGSHSFLMHPQRRGGRHKELWNIAVDYVVNGWQLDDLNARGRNALDEFQKNLGTAYLFSDFIQNLKDKNYKPQYLKDIDLKYRPKPKFNDSDVLTEEQKKDLKDWIDNRPKVFYADPNIPIDQRKPEVLYDLMLAAIPRCPSCGKLGAYDIQAQTPIAKSQGTPQTKDNVPQTSGKRVTKQSQKKQAEQARKIGKAIRKKLEEQENSEESNSDSEQQENQQSQDNSQHNGEQSKSGKQSQSRKQSQLGKQSQSGDSSQSEDQAQSDGKSGGQPGQPCGQSGGKSGGQSGQQPGGQPGEQSDGQSDGQHGQSGGTKPSCEHGCCGHNSSHESSENSSSENDDNGDDSSESSNQPSQNSNNQGANKGCQCPSCGKSDSEGEFDWLGDGLVDDHMDSEETEEEMYRRIYEAVETAKKMAGSVPAGLEDELGLLVKPKVRWEDFIRSRLHRARTGNARNDYTRYKTRPLCAGLLSPKRKGYKAKFAALLDTSGSMSATAITHVVSQLRGLDQNGEGIIVPADAEIYWNDATILKSCSDEDLKRTKVVGRGGTNFLHFLEEYPEKIGKVDFIVVMTDGYLYEEVKNSLKPAVDVIWLIIGNASFTAPFGRIFYLDEME